GPGSERSRRYRRNGTSEGAAEGTVIPLSPSAGAAPGLGHDALFGYPDRADQPAQRFHAAELVEPADQLRERIRLAGVRGGGRLLDRPGHLSVDPEVEHPRAGHARP